MPDHSHHDSSPLNGRSPTSSWQAGDIRFDSETIPLSAQLTPVPGTYNLAIKLYWYGDQKALPVKSNGSAPTEYFVLKPVDIEFPTG